MDMYAVQLVNHIGYHVTAPSPVTTSDVDLFHVIPLT